MPGGCATKWVHRHALAHIRFKDSDPEPLSRPVCGGVDVEHCDRGRDGAGQRAGDAGDGPRGEVPRRAVWGEGGGCVGPLPSIPCLYGFLLLRFEREGAGGWGWGLGLDLPNTPPPKKMVDMRGGKIRTLLSTKKKPRSKPSETEEKNSVKTLAFLCARTLW